VDDGGTGGKRLAHNCYNAFALIATEQGFFFIAIRCLMSEKLMKFFLDELTIVRLVCTKNECGGVIEVPMKALAIGGKEFSCPGCRERFNTMLAKALETLEPLTMLGCAAQCLEGQNARFKVQFVLPDKSE
jgi:hypothetical protein